MLLVSAIINVSYFLQLFMFVLIMLNVKCSNLNVLVCICNLWLNASISFKFM